jgi:hypothetical protein
MVNTPPPPAYEHEEYNHIVEYYDRARDEDGASAPGPPAPSSNAPPPAPAPAQPQAPTLREGTMNGQAPRQTSLHEDVLPAPGRPAHRTAIIIL